MTSDYPSSLEEPLHALLRSLGDSTDILSAESLGGGCINHALKLQTRRKAYFLKWNHDPLPGMFETEAHGLELLAQTHTVHVPQSLGFADIDGARPAYLLTEWLEGTAGDPFELGQQVAKLHLAEVESPARYGLDRNNYLGSSPQLNTWDTDWVNFFAHYRLAPQMELAEQNGVLTDQRHRQLETLLQRLPELLATRSERHPTLIHGDLWAGNVIPSANGYALIDPAVSYSDPEAEIAYTELFGGFGFRFYTGYQMILPLDSGYAQRHDIYNLYHLLNHLNLFGEEYGAQVDGVLAKYAG